MEHPAETCSRVLPREPRRTAHAARATEAASHATLTLPMTLFFAAAVGVIVVNLAAAQPLAGLVGRSLHLRPAFVGAVATLPQLGYAAGLLLLVPLCDLLENRRLIFHTLLACAAFLALGALARSGALFLAAVFFAGATSSVIQMLVPMAAAMAPESRRGRAVGNVMSGLMLGILLSRPLASLVAGTLGWRAFYGIEAVADALLAIVLFLRTPRRTPAVAARYADLLRSLWTLLRTERVLRRSAILAALALGAFSAFWTAIALLLAQPPFSLGMNGIAAFALAGATGAIVTPMAGRLGDRGAGHAVQYAAHATMPGAVLLLGMAGAGWGGFSPAAHPALALGLLVAGAAALDAGVIADQTLGRRAINLLNPAARGRLNAIFVGMFFVGGAAGALMAGAAWAWARWSGVCLVALGFTVAVIALGVVYRATPGAGR
ncbi:MFS transporter [Paraburkholderia lycopersici]|uniref:Predicted arabinose efflux permease, MFS family n=1 Tax=Paraburkholderia lycopersici TaxID=416944 RepID=A0A1G7DC30_9BURK|nr:MFS transporter [Paraburkholderia lycopersici]SDE49049.1 Predicted arabinose efflux permease, MFS family [Paraburkholderia lycopersici]